MIAAPYILGAGSDLFWKFVDFCQSGAEGGTGAVKAAHGALGSVPGIGSALTAGGWVSILAPGVIGIGGAWLGNYVHTHYDRHGHIPWGNVIRYASLATSFLIALPSLLSGVSVGLTFLAFALGGVPAAYGMVNALYNTVGFMGKTSVVAAGGGLSGLAAHLLTCGTALLPAGAMLMGNHPAKTDGAFTVKLLPHAPLRVGQPCHLSFQLLDGQTGRPLNADELKVVHTQPLHTMIVDSGLQDYHHLHPRYDAASGTFICSFVPQSHLPYRMWNEAQLVDNVVTSQASAPISAHANYAPPAMIATNSEAQVHGIQARIMPQSPLRQSQSCVCDVRLTDASGAPISLEPIMGAYAHLVAFSADGKHFMHCHPLGAEPQSPSDRGNGHLQFHLMPDWVGGAKFFLQVRHEGQDITLPFGQMIRPSMQFTSRTAMDRHHMELVR